MKQTSLCFCSEVRLVGFLCESNDFALIVAPTLFSPAEFKPLPGSDAVEFQLCKSPQFRDRGHLIVAGSEGETLNEAASSASVATHVSHFLAAFGLALGSYHAFEYFQQHRGNGSSH